jgi:hypothetical protein
MSIDNDAKTTETSIFTDIMKKAKDKKAAKADETKETSPAREKFIYFAKQAAILGTVVAGTALITLKLNNMKNEKTDEVPSDEAVNTDEI